MGKEDRRRHFTREFKRNAVHLVTEKGMPVGKNSHRPAFFLKQALMQLGEDTTFICHSIIPRWRVSGEH